MFRTAFSIIFIIIATVLNSCYGGSLPNYSNIDIDVEDCSELTTDGLYEMFENNNTAEEFRTAYGLGSCHKLEGEQTVVLFFMDDDESSWTKADVIDFTNKRVLPALDFLQEQAENWGIELSFKVKRFSTPLSDGTEFVYKGTVNKDLTATGSTKDLPEQTAKILGFSNEDDFLAVLNDEYDSNSVIPLMLINKDGTAYARKQLVEGLFGHIEHAVIFADGLGFTNGSWRYIERRTATVAHEILHLFGAEDYYLNPQRLKLAEKYCINDIMLLDTYDIERLNVDEITAYYVGWTDEIPEVVFNGTWGKEE